MPQEHNWYLCDAK